MKKAATRFCPIAIAALVLIVFISFSAFAAQENPVSDTPEETRDASILPHLTYTIQDGQVTITDCDTSLTGRVDIPDTIEGFPVTQLGYSAFFGCDQLESITIPDTVTTISKNAFYGCKKLEEIFIPASVTSIANNPFAGCSSLNKIIAAEENNFFSSDDRGVLYNKDKTFLQAAPGNLSGSYTVADTTRTIGTEAFYECAALTGITIGDSVTRINESAYNRCTGLRNLTLSHNLQAIPRYAFYNCFSLSVIVIPDQVSTIGYSAFYGCNQMAITMTHSVTYIDHYAFYGSVKNVYFYGTEAQWNAIFIGQYNHYLTRAPRQYLHDHLFSLYIPNGDATCLADGTKTAKCDFCEVTDTQPDVGSADHVFVNYAFNNNATFTADGTQTSLCSYCDATSTIPAPNTMLLSPKNATSTAGATAVFSVSPHPLAVSYHWQYSRSENGSWFYTSMTGYNTEVLSVAVTNARNHYRYRCIITLQDGRTLTSLPGELSVLSTISVSKHPGDKTVTVGIHARFTTAAVGYALKYQWQCKQPGSEIWNSVTDVVSTRPTMMIPANSSLHGNQYRCLITDNTGNQVFTDPATLYVLRFATTPTDVYASKGEIATFTATATAPTGYTIYWQYRRSESGTWHNTTMTGYNTDTLYVPVTAARNGYQYRCVLVGEKNGKLFSEAVTLYVN